MTEPVFSRLQSGIRSEFEAQGWVPGLTSGMLIGIKEVIFAVSVGSLLFAGDLTAFLPYGIGIALVTQIVMLASIALGSSQPGVMGGLQDTSSVILAALAGAILSSLPSTQLEDRLATVLVGIAATTVLTGVVLWALGTLRLGGLVRFVPYPVIGGFLAGTGWLLVQGAFPVMTQRPFDAWLTTCLQPEQLVIWVPGVVLALALLAGLRAIKHFLTMPAILLGAFALFYLVLALVGISTDEAASRGLLLGTVSGDAVWQPLVPKNLASTHWLAIFEHSGSIAIVVMLSLVGLLLNASGIELAMRQDVELNRELQVAGIANVLSGLGGGAVGYHALDLSTLCCRIGARGRLPGLVAAAVSAAALFAGAPLLALAPRPILGGLLLFLGLDFLVEWVVMGWRRLSPADYTIVCLILGVIAASGFLVGVGVGLAAMLLLFVVNYSRVGVVHHAFSGAEMQSNVERSAHHRRRLRELGTQVFILELRGFLFFGTANALLGQIRARVTDASLPEVRYVVLDFRRVTGLDSSAVLSFLRCRQMLESLDMQLVLTHLSTHMLRQFDKGGLSGKDATVRIFADLDSALESCEEALLHSAQVTLVNVPLTLRAQLAELGFDREDGQRLMAFLQRVEVEEGGTLVQQGVEAGDLYFIERGKVTVYLELPDATRVRLRTMGPATAVGELGLLLERPRSATVIADWSTTAYRLTRAALDTMKRTEPDLAAAFYELLARILAERMTSKNQSLEAMLR